MRLGRSRARDWMEEEERDFHHRRPTPERDPFSLSLSLSPQTRTYALYSRKCFLAKRRVAKGEREREERKAMNLQPSTEEREREGGWAGQSAEGGQKLLTE